MLVGAICLCWLEQFVYVGWSNLFILVGAICLYWLEQFVYVGWSNLFMLLGAVCLCWLEQFVYVVWSSLFMMVGAVWPIWVLNSIGLHVKNSQTGSLNDGVSRQCFSPGSDFK